jgi:twinkle protein
MNTSDIEKTLLMSLRKTLTALYPNGEVKGGEFVLGNIQGDRGDSLKIRLKDGVWADFATGQKGKMLKLFSERNGSFKAGMDEVRSILKIPPPPKQNKFKRPKEDWISIIENDSRPVLDYLIKDRKIPKSVILASKVKATDDSYVFTGYDEDNKIAYAQYIKLARTKDGKKQVRFSPDNKQAKLVLWGMHTMNDLNVDGSVVITEGVIDAMSYRAAGIFAVSIPSGASNTEWIEHCWNWLAQFNKIYLCFDYDTAGQDQIRHIAGRLGMHKCFKVILPEKDANEIWIKDNGAELLKKSLVEAVDIAPEKRVTANRLKESVREFIKAGPIEDRGDLLLGWHFPDRPFRPGINFRFRGSEQTVWTGYAGSGKTTLLFQHASYSMFMLGQKVAIATLEEPAEKTIATIITQALGYFPESDSREFDEAFSIIENNLFIYNQVGRTDIDEALEFFEYASKRDGADHCILDSLMRTNIDIDGDKAKVNEIILKIIESTNKVGAHYHIVAHAVKGDDEDYASIPSLASIKGVQEIGANAHNVIAVWRNKPKENAIEGILSKNQPSSAAEAERKYRDKGDTIIKICKNRNGKRYGQIPAWFDPHSSRFRPEPDKAIDRPYFSLETDPPC